jgi:acetoin:2,6-dichlorophenolindophenol oxidoreductase subunit beta
LQALLSHIPGLAVIMPSSARQMEEAYKYAVSEYQGPVLSIEHRWLYDTTFAEHGDVEPVPFKARKVQDGKDVTIVATSYMVQEAQRAAAWVKENGGVSCEIIDPFIVSDLDHDMIFESVKRTGRLIVADTSYLNYGVAAEVARGIVTRDPSVLKAPPEMLGLKYVPTPTSHQLESLFYPDSGSIVNSIYKLVHGDKHDGILPSDELKKSQWVNFKGPF